MVLYGPFLNKTTASKDGIEKYDDFITKSDGPEDENKQEIQLVLEKECIKPWMREEHGSAWA